MRIPVAARVGILAHGLLKALGYAVRMAKRLFIRRWRMS